MAPKTYVLDTCVLLADPQALLRFDEHHVVLPLVVIEELDKHKSRMDELGANARRSIRLLEELGSSRSGGLAEPVAIGGGGSLRIELNGVASKRLPPVLDPSTPDHRILATCLNMSEGTVLVTRDASLRIKAAQLGVEVEDYRADTVHVDESYRGVRELEVPGDLIDELFDGGKADIGPESGAGLVVNEFVILKGPGSQSGLGRVIETGGRVVVARVHGTRQAFGIESKNVQQAFALDLLLDPDIAAVSLMGMAGTGKTFLALAAALEQVVETDRYRRAAVYRPLVAVGRQEVGFLPGDLGDKLAPWMAAVHDNLHALFSGSPGSARDAIDELVERDLLEMAAITYLRGRSITGEIVIIDEAQNLELPTLKVILTRMSRGSKVVFCGDLTQVDNPYVSPFGGLAALIEKFKGSPLFGHVTLERSVRSPLAEFAATAL